LALLNQEKVRSNRIELGRGALTRKAPLLLRDPATTTSHANNRWMPIRFRPQSEADT
jgi:hypothetical protein